MWGRPADEKETDLRRTGHVELWAREHPKSGDDGLTVWLKVVGFWCAACLFLLGGPVD